MEKQSSAQVSLCMIVRNEAHQLAECLAPLAELFDDIVIVDTGSCDDTRRVAQQFTSRVFDFPWRDDFSAARNEALRHARGEWIFWLDADDRLSPDNVAKLRRLVAGLTDRHQGFLMTTVLHLDPRTRDRQRLATHLRLFRRHPALAWHRRVHEQLRPWPTAIGYEMIDSDVQIDHYGYTDSLLTQRKLRRNIRLLRMDFAINPDDPTVLVDLGFAYAQLGQTGEARRFLHRALDSREPSPYLSRRVFTTLGELEGEAGNFTAQLDAVTRGLACCGGDAYLSYMHAEALYNLSEYEAAKSVLVSIIQGPRSAPDMQVGVPHDVHDRLAPLGLGEVLRCQCELRQAEEVLRGVAQQYPDDPTTWYYLGRVYVDWRDWQKLDDVLARLSASPSGSVFGLLLTAVAQITRGELSAAEATLDALIAQAPGMLIAREMRAAALHRRGAPRAVQLQANRDILRLQPANSQAATMVQRLQNAVPAVSFSETFGLSSSLILGAGVPNGVVSV